MIIRTSLAVEIQKFDKQLLGYTTSMAYNFAQLCVTADATSLLPIEMKIDGEVKHIDDVASAVVHQKERDGDDITIELFPNNPAYITAIMDGVFEFHPEFKQTIEDMRDQPGNEDMKAFMEEHKDEIDDEMEVKCKYIRLVMPDVNKDRRDLLTKAVEGYRDALTLTFKALKAKAQATIAPLAVGVPKEEVDAAYERIDKTYKTYDEMADNLTEEKKKQIEDAYHEYIKRCAESIAPSYARQSTYL